VGENSSLISLYAIETGKAASVETATMLRRFLCSEKCLIILALCISSCAISGCLESTFTLASESRLPRFVTLPPGLTRADASLTMSYYVWPWGRSATFILRDKKGQILSKVSGREKGLEPLQLKNPTKGFPPGYPAFEVITTHGITEIIEHKKMEPIFYINDDPAVRKELLADGEGL
jgi:hypothetical protein